MLRDEFKSKLVKLRETFQPVLETANAAGHRSLVVEVNRDLKRQIIKAIETPSEAAAVAGLLGLLGIIIGEA
jgi:hypothetical protein